MTWDPKNDIYKQFAKTPDSELLEWEQFVTIRHNDIIKLAQGVMRPPVDLVLQGVEKTRPSNEWKQVIENAEFSKQPLYKSHRFEELNRLKDRCPHDKVYKVKKTKLERGILKVIDHVGCPEYIQKTEKGMLGETEKNPCVRLDADFRQYRARREKELKKQMQKFEPFKPDMKDLIVIGRNPQPVPPPPPMVPVISITPPQGPPLEAPCGIYALRINNTVLVKDIPNQHLPHLKRLQEEPWHETRYTWTYYLNNPISRLGEAKLYLQNLGTVAIKYCWQKLQKLIPFIPDYTYEQKFFFNKGENIINPGQSRTIYFTFISETPGIHLETWKLSLINICFFDNTNDKLTIELIGDCAENMKKITSRIEKLQFRINHKAVRKFAYDFIINIIDVVTGVEHQYYPYKKYLLEAEMFVTKNPLCFYHQTEVQYLKDLYMEMEQEEWDLSIPSWRQAMINKPFEERMAYYDQLNKSFVILLKPWREGGGILEQKYRAVTLLLGKLFDKFYTEKAHISKWNGAEHHAPDSHLAKDLLTIAVPRDHLTADVVQNIFYLRMYEHVAYTMELIAAIVSSIDLYRWIDFDFCKL